MKVLLVTQYYWPENSRVTDIAESLQKEGVDVTVLTGLPNYPSGYIFKDYKHGQNRKEFHNGVSIIRSKLIGRRKNIFFRFLNYYSFPYFASRAAKKLSKDFNVVLVVQLSPILLAKPAIVYAKRNNKNVVMYEMDLWPESLLSGGIKPNGVIYEHYKKVSSKIYSSCNKILVSTNEHIDYIKKLPNCSGLKIEYLPQYAEAVFEDEKYNNFENGVIDLLFAGNIGKAQSLDVVLNAASLLKSKASFHFHIVGGGSEFQNIKKMSEDMLLKNVTIYGPRPIEDMKYFYNLADVMLCPPSDLKNSVNLTLPGKIQSYMAVGKPIIGIIDGATERLIKESNCGVSVRPGDYKGLSDAILNLKQENLLEYGKNARKYYDSHFKKELFMKRLIDELKIFSS